MEGERKREGGLFFFKLSEIVSYKFIKCSQLNICAF